LRGTEGEREEKGKELVRNVSKGKIKKQFFLIDWGGPQSRKKEKIWGAMLCQKVARKRKKKIKKKIAWHP
jgi:hypothetical protein